MVVCINFLSFLRRYPFLYFPLHIVVRVLFKKFLASFSILFFSFCLDKKPTFWTCKFKKEKKKKSEAFKVFRSIFLSSFSPRSV